MTRTAQQAGREHDFRLYTEVQHFYGRQMRFLDEGAVEQWAGTFAEDGVFEANTLLQTGRPAIENGARETTAKLEASGLQRRHWLGMLEVQEQPDGTVLAKTYAIVYTTPRGGKPAADFSCSCQDVLARGDGEFQVLRREVRRDDLSAA
ncbi:nuclear transport factor 2 family protein [Amycolatopsis sp. WGS_07]|uniref:nuclear transport factor 2 family protein n=1 Tax=Amycolatopsis sp. WGS_07 TaxID=3076764 RepID=UPI0038736232